MCVINEAICGNGTCRRGPQGHYCTCHSGYTNYGNKQSPCTELNCDALKADSDVAPETITYLNSICSELTESNSLVEIHLKHLLKDLVPLIDSSNRSLNDTMEVLDLVDTVVNLNGPPVTDISFQTEMAKLIPTSDKKAQGLVILSFLTDERGPSPYSGLTTVLALSYPNLEEHTDGNFSGIEAPKGKGFKLNSKVMTLMVTSRSKTKKLKSPVLLRLDHLEQSNDTHTCVFWNSSEEGGRWSQHGCHVVENNSHYTVCSYNHLSSFAVLREIEDQFELRLITWVGLSLSLVCLFICILTFSLIRSIQSPRTTIHLHLCINLFVATLIFLVGISRTENKVGCAVIAGLLHFFYLAAFCWMCLEGVQLFRMVVLVFNTSFKTLYMMAAGYGVPALIVAVSAATNPKGYGTRGYCWLSLDYFWSFFRPLCMIVSVNISFFLITVWKLAQKFSSLNPELDKLQKIRTFVIIAVVSLCLLGTMWIFGYFMLMTDSLLMEYLFTISGSIQGVLLFITHCLSSKQVRDEYKNRLTARCSPRQTKASNFRCVHSRQAHASKSSQDTGEAQIQEVL
ncbi:putative adhesion G protein-coupled receptor E4P [Neosynchiropus ocellatus]